MYLPIRNHHAIGATNPHGSRGVLLSSSDTKKDEDYEAMLRREVEVISMAIYIIYIHIYIIYAYIYIYIHIYIYMYNYMISISMAIQ